MALKLYIAYGTASDQVTALRLQALAAVNGLVVYVPPGHTRNGAPAPLDSQSETKLREADVILGIVTSGLSEACRQELNTGKTLGKSMIVMAEPAVASGLEPFFPGKILALNPSDPAQAELAMVQFLKQTELHQGARNALVALGTIALGLLLFTSLAPQD